MQAISVQPPVRVGRPGHSIILRPDDLMFSGSLAEIPQPVNLAGPRSVSGASLRNGSVVDELLDRFATAYPGGDRRAIASQWSKWLFHAWLSPTIAVMVLDGYSLPRQSADWGMRFTPDGRPERLWLSSTTVPVRRQPVDRLLAQLVCEELDDVVATLARHSGASVNVFWSNAGNLVEHVLTRLAEHPVTCADRLAQARAFLEAPRLAGRRNRLYRPVVYRVDEGSIEPQRLRRVCCIRYRLDELDYCENCPLACRSGKPAGEGR
ncbi:siderophore-iron reductase FhuF [Guyparkeria sp. TX1]|uniref:siderophore-iron reductase FhuF n=1 Tax=Guyparkeria sp. TX1 TaxID=3115001 RepID=UPI003977409D